MHDVCRKANKYYSTNHPLYTQITKLTGFFFPTKAHAVDKEDYNNILKDKIE